MEKMEDRFKIRAYGRTELAVLYNPHLSANAANRKLKQWIAVAPGLWERLVVLGKGRSRTWTPAQVEAIIAALGEP